MAADFDPVNKPEHYNSHPSGVECAEITEHMTCMIGCAIKYLWRHGQKAGADADEDLRKAIWCIERERLRLSKMRAPVFDVTREQLDAHVAAGRMTKHDGVYYVKPGHDEGLDTTAVWGPAKPVKIESFNGS